MKEAPLESVRERPRVLLIAYACEPNRGSEPGTGWNMAMGLAAECDISVITRANNRGVIESFLEENTAPLPRFIYVDPPHWVIRLKKAGLLPVQIFYAIWQWQVARVLRKDVGGDYDIIHQLTFNSFEVPPLAFFDSTVIKVWGPIGGGQMVPSGMLRSFGLLGGVKEGFRNLRVRISAHNPLCRKALSKCSLVLYANGETQDLLSGSCSGEMGVMIDVGVDMGKFAPVERDPRKNGTTILFAGRLEARKGGTLILEAFAKLAGSREGLQLRIVGDGPQRAAMERYAIKKGLADRVRFAGGIGHRQMAEEFAGADIFAFPSLRDTSGTIVLEAMSMCLPVVCFNHQGAAIMVDDDCGIKIQARSRSAAIDGLAEAVARLVDNKALALAFGRRSRESVLARHDWASKVRRISGYYSSLRDGMCSMKENQPSRDRIAPTHDRAF